jgi:trimeric autotransporter adhesin
MKKSLLIGLFVTGILFVHAQTTYYWVGSSTGTPNIGTNANWNTLQNGLGSARTSATGATDILVFDGVNLGGTTIVTGAVTVNANTSITCAQMKFSGNVTVNMVRPSTGTSTITVSGDAGDDFVIDTGSTFNVPVTTAGSIRFAMAAANSGKVSGTMSIISTQQFRFDNTTTGTGLFVFTSGSSMFTNITATSSSYAFGSSTQSSEGWVVFDAGAQLYYDGGYSPVGSGNLYSALNMKPGSVWHHRATNATTGFGNFFNRKYYGDIIVENNATLTALGPIYRIGNLTINSGSSFVTHTSGQTAVAGNLVVDGIYSSPAANSNELLFCGTAAQTVSGAGTISTNSFIVGDNANVVMNKSIAVEQAAVVNGKLNFNANQLTGTATFRAEGIITPVAGTANTVTGLYQLSGNVGIATTARGQKINGAGIPANTVIVGFSATADTIYISSALTATGTAVPLMVTTGAATLITANANGFNAATGSAAVTGNKNYQDYINYTINTTTTVPFGVSTGSVEPSVKIGFAEVNANITANKSIHVSQYVMVNAKFTLRPLDTVHIQTGGIINGAFSNTKYIATDYNATTGEQSFVQYDGLTTAATLPVGTVTNYLPVILTPANASNFRVAVFEGITTNGTVNGTQLTAVQKQSVVNAVWNINRLTGTGNAGVKLQWVTALEGSTFTTLPSTDIGLIMNTGSSYTLPVGVGDNVLNTVTATVTSFGAFAAGAVPPAQPFIFNPIAAKTYGNADFNGGATSLNTTQPIVYSSSNTAVATIVSGNIHIVGAGTSDITASQASDGFYAAASITRTLTVNKAALTITADNITRFEAQPNPPLTATYTGFVLGETTAALTTQATISTTAVIASSPGTYPITVTGATSGNYTVTFVNGTLTVQAKQTQTITFAAPAVKTYGNADFATGATSTNNTIPITYTSSNTNVATIISNNIHIVGAGTANITASQAGNAGYFAAADVIRTLTVNKANLTIKVSDTTKMQGQPNPPFTLIYTGFVLGETATNLLTPVVVTTLAGTSSSAGYYAITLSGATSNNYNITYTNARLTIYPATGTGVQNLNVYMSNSTTLTVRAYSPEPALGDIQLYDVTGKPLLKKNLYLSPGFVSTDIYIPLLPAGIYVVTLRGNNVDLKKTILITH